MKIAFPNMGPNWVAFKTLFETFCGHRDTPFPDGWAMIIFHVPLKAFSKPSISINHIKLFDIFGNCPEKVKSFLENPRNGCPICPDCFLPV